MNFMLRVESPDQKVIVYLPENEGSLIKEITRGCYASTKKKSQHMDRIRILYHSG